MSLLYSKRGRIDRLRQNRNMRLRLVISLPLLLCVLALYAEPAHATADAAFDSLSVPAGGGIVLAVWSHGPASALPDAAATGGCNLAAAWRSADGRMTGYVPGAPSAVNEEFLQGTDGELEDLQPLLVSCGPGSIGGEVRPQVRFPRPPSIPGQANLVQHASYEAGLDILETLQTATTTGLMTTAALARSGEQASEVTLKAGDPRYGDIGYRSEYQSTFYPKRELEYWYGLSVYMPADWHQGVNSRIFDDRIITQFHEGTGGSPAFSLHVLETGEFMLRRRSGPDQLTELWYTEFTTERWYDFGFKVRWSRGGTGYFQLYMDGRLMYEYKGRTLIDGGTAYMKWGIYGQPTRLFIDDVWIAQPQQ